MVYSFLLLYLIRVKNAIYHQRILEALPDATDFWDVQQLVELAAALARRGFPQARRAIYDKFELQQFNETCLGGCQIVLLNGIEGLLRVAEVIGARFLLCFRFTCQRKFWLTVEQAGHILLCVSRCGSCRRWLSGRHV